MLGTNLLLGAIAGFTIFLGLPIARWKAVSNGARGVLALISAGILLFLIIEIGYHAMEEVEKLAIMGNMGQMAQLAVIMAGGVGLGLVGLAWLEDVRGKRRSSGAPPMDVAMMIAIGIGLHNFAEGLAIGQSFSGGAADLGIILVIGFALHNATEGFGIAAPIAGETVSWKRLLLLGFIGGAPTALGAAVGGIWVNQVVEILFLSIALGSLIYVTRELLRIKFETLAPVTGMAALCIGLFLGFATELAAEVGQARSAETNVASTHGVNVRFEDGKASADRITVARGQTITIENATKQDYIFEGEGLFPGEIAVGPSEKKSVMVRGKGSTYALTDENGNSAKVIVKVTEEAATRAAQ